MSEQRFTARLLHGETYHYGTTLYKKMEDHDINESLKNYLEDNAVDWITMDGGNVERCKFQFKNADDEWPAHRRARRRENSEEADDRPSRRMSATGENVDSVATPASKRVAKPTAKVKSSTKVKIGHKRARN